MVDYLFGPAIAWDPTSNGPVTSASFTVYDLADAGNSTPLSATDTNGLPVTPTSNGEGFLVPFIVADHPDIKVVDSTGRECPLHSVEGMRDATEAAQAAAATSAQAASDAQAAAESAASDAAGAVRTVNGVGPDSSGNVNVSGGGSGGSGIVTVAGRGPDGSGNVPLTTGDIGAAPATHTHAASAITSGVVAQARLGSGTADDTTFLRGDGVWATPAGGGGGGSVESVNGVTPDGSGNVALSKAHIGLGSVDNTSDANKPVSIATQSALNGKAADSAVVKLTGNQTVDGVKTFSSAPVLPDGSLGQAKVAGLVTALAARLPVVAGSPVVPTGIWFGAESEMPVTPDANTLYFKLEEV